MPTEVTIVITPRERYSGILSCIESVYSNTPDTAFELVYADGALPADVAEAVQRESEKRGFKFIRFDYPLTPNEGRNFGVENAETPYVVFVDNDVTVTPHWLEPLLDTAKETNAWLVGPVTLDGNFPNERIHSAGGDARIDVVHGKRHMHLVPHFSREHVAEVQSKLERGPVSMIENHVLLLRRDIFDTIGRLDEEVLGIGDLHDFVTQVNEAGGTTILEPASKVILWDASTNGDLLTSQDLPWYLLRWSDEWNKTSVDKIAENWNLDPADPWIDHAQEFGALHRRKAYRLGGVLGRAVGFTMYNLSRSLGAAMERQFCSRYTKRLAELRRNKNARGSTRQPAAPTV